MSSPFHPVLPYPTPNPDPVKHHRGKTPASIYLIKHRVSWHATSHLPQHKHPSIDRQKKEEKTITDAPTRPAARHQPRTRAGGQASALTWLGGARVRHAVPWLPALVRGAESRAWDMHDTTRHASRASGGFRRAFVARGGFPHVCLGHGS